MRDDFYRQCCSNPASYDKVIDWIKSNNPAAKNGWFYSPRYPDTVESGAEQFASEVVNSCIRTVIFGENHDASTGMAIAIRASDDISHANFKKVILAVAL